MFEACTGIGSLRTAIIYFGSGLASGLVSVYILHLINPDVIRFAAGASGAIFGVMCAILLLISVQKLILIRLL